MFYDNLFERLSRTSFLTGKRKANFVAYKPFFVIEKKIDKILQLGYFNDSLLCTKIISLEDNDTGNLETAISTDHFNNLSCKTSCPGNEKRRDSDIVLNTFGEVQVAEQPFIPRSSPLLPLNMTTSQWCLTQPSSNKAQRPAFILLLHCEGLLTPPSQSSNLHTEGWQGLSITSQPWGTPGFKEAFLDVYPQ